MPGDLSPSSASRRFAFTAAAGVAILAGMQLVRPAMTNPVTDSSRTMAAVVPDSRIAGVIDRSCRDCHTNETRWPWYSHVAPLSWMVARHVAEGREAVNFSDWAAYEAGRQRNILRDACDEVRHAEMPIRSYTWLHPETKLTRQDVDAICAMVPPRVTNE